MFTTPDLLRGERILPLRVDDVDRMLEIGVLESGERVELLHGLLVVMDVDGDAHIDVTARLNERLVLALAGSPFIARCQSSAKMGDYQLPSPDFVVVPRKHESGRYVGGLLVVEVANSSLSKDRAIKSAIYASAKVPEYWIVDVNAKVVEVYSDPAGKEFRARVVVPRTGTLSPRELPGVTISVDELFREDA